MGQKNIHYFPGHMSKAIKDMSNFIKSIDLVCEVVDARAPLSSRNPLLDSLIQGKDRILLLSKKDFADEKATQKWITFFKNKGFLVSSANLKNDKFISVLSEVSSELIKKKREKEAKYGMKPQPIRVMIVGIPNVGKSTLINNLSGSRVAITGNKAGVTRGEQWIKLSSNFILLDTPGILPMKYEDKQIAVNLALIGSMKEEVLPNEELTGYLLNILREHYPDCLKNRYGIEDLSNLSNDDVLLEISKRRNLLVNNLLSTERSSYLIIKEFKDGILGRYSLEFPNA